MITNDYAERVYAGVLGKIIGVYVGRPFEGWPYERIMKELGEVNHYVHERLGHNLIVTDDDITGTFTFLRALEDNGNSRDLTPEQIGMTWMNYLIENKTILWWGGLGTSTEHTAYLRLKSGIPAPASGSIEMNGRVVAEQIGAQIFIDGWGMVCPGEPELAAEFARKAGSVSHDGEAVYAAQVIAAIEAMAFVDPDVDALLDKAVSLIPSDSLIARLIGDLREWYAADGDWTKTFSRIQGKYGYDKYGGGCHVIPNHALVILGLLYGRDDFQKAMMITNTAGWDTDCNGANIGCIMGIRLGLDGIDRQVDFRGPVADRLFLPTADSGRSISDALREAYAVVNMGLRLHGMEPVAPKGGARYHFSLPGSVQGFMCEDSPESRGTATITNDGGSLAIRYCGVGPGRACRVGTATFVPESSAKMGGYDLIASPTLYTGQTVVADIVADQGNAGPVELGLYARVYGNDDKPSVIRAASLTLAPGETAKAVWTLPCTGGQPIETIGIEIRGYAGNGTVYLDSLTWDGVPDTTLGMPEGNGGMWKRAWADSTNWHNGWNSREFPYDLIQNLGCGLKTIGEAEWRDYAVSTRVRPHLADAAGLAVNFRGLRRYCALLVCRAGMARLIDRFDGVETVLAEAPIAWELDRTYELAVTTRADGTLVGNVDGTELTAVVDPSRARGAMGLVLESGRSGYGPVTIKPAR